MKKFLFGLVLLLSGCSTHHYHFYPSHDERKEVRAYSTEKIKPVIEFRVKQRNEASIEAIVDMLENVPDVIQEKVNAHGVKFVIFDGKLTDNPEMAAYKGKTASEPIPLWEGGELVIKQRLWDDKLGAYHLKKCFIQQDYSVSPEERKEYPFYTVELHENGHGVDKAYGWISSSKEFQRLFNKYGKHSSLPDDERRSCQEFFASRFSEYYHSDDARRVLAKRFPEVHLFFKTWALKDQ